MLLPLSFWLTREYGVQGAVVATVGTALALLPLNATLVARALGVTARQLLAAVWRPLVAAAIMYGVTVLAQPPVDTATLTAGRGLMLLAIFVPLGAATYVAANWRSGCSAAAHPVRKPLCSLRRPAIGGE